MMPAAKTVHGWRSAGATHPGLERTSNQDAWLALPQSGLWVIADGMGGYQAGDLASRSVCDALADFAPGATLETSIDELRERINEVNQQLHAASLREVDPVQSGSTVVMLLAAQDACAALWAGDSRVYRLRQRELLQITIDHSWAAQLSLRGIKHQLTDHTILRAVGGEATLVLDVKRDQVQCGDRYLICSDGLYRELTLEQMAALLANGEVQHCVQALLEAALAAGAHDNVSLIVVEAG
jgi:serine/threonine protein phosphatase PrpC